MTKKLMLVGALMMLFSSFSQARDGTGNGNGGDYIRMRFIEIGKEVLNKYRPRLEPLSNVVSIKELEKTLSIKVIKTKKRQVYDNQRNPVDAIGKKGRIVLFRGKDSENTGWYGLLKKYGVVEKLVLHEMFRAAGVNDDDYAYTNQIVTQVSREKSTREFNLYWNRMVLKQILLWQEDLSKQGADQELRIYNEIFERLNTYTLIDYFQQQGTTLRMINDLVQSGMGGRIDNTEKRDILSHLLVTFELDIAKLVDDLDQIEGKSMYGDAVQLRMNASALETEFKSLDLIFETILEKSENKNVSKLELRDILEAKNSPSIDSKRLALEELVRKYKK